MGLPLCPRHRAMSVSSRDQFRRFQMSKEEDNKAVVVQWFTDFWGENVNLSVVDDIASPDMLLKYSLHEPRRGHADIKAFMTDFRAAFPDLQFGATADLIPERDYVVAQWDAGATHTAPASRASLIASLPPQPTPTLSSSRTPLLSAR